MSNPTAETVYRSLVDLGLSETSVTLDDFERVYRGPLQDVLLFFSEHVKGRAGVIEARSSILGFTDFCNKQRSNATKRTAYDVATSRMAKVKKDTEIYSRELENEMKIAKETHVQMTALKSKLQTNRRVKLMLERLEIKEKERIRRFEEIGILLAELKRNALSSTRDKYISHPSKESFEFTAGLSAFKKPRQTQDTLTSLNAYHVRLARLSQSGRNLRSNVQSAETELRRLVAQKLEVDDENVPEVGRVLDGFLKAARAQAENRTRYTSIVDKTRKVSTKELNMLASRTKQTAANLQDASNLSLKLARASEQAVTSLAHFQTTTAPSVHESLSSQSTTIQNYVDRLRTYCVMAGEHEAERMPEFDREVRHILGLSEASTPEKVLEEVERLIRSVYSKTRHLEAVKIHPPPLPDKEEVEILASYESHQREMEDFSEQLLTRKIAKADLGQGLVEDIEILLKEVKDIVGHGSGRTSKR